MTDHLLTWVIYPIVTGLAAAYLKPVLDSIGVALSGTYSRWRLNRLGERNTIVEQLAKAPQLWDAFAQDEQRYRSQSLESLAWGLFITYLAGWQDGGTARFVLGVIAAISMLGYILSKVQAHRLGTALTAARLGGKDPFSPGSI